MSGGRPLSVFEPHRISSNGFIMKPDPQARYYFRTSTLQQDLNPNLVTPYRWKFNWVALVIGIIIALLLATLIIVLAVVLTRQSQKADEVSQTSSTTQTPSPNVSQTVEISVVTETPPVAEPSVAQLIGNFTILGKTPGDVNDATICAYINEQLVKRNQTATYCRITDLRSGSVRVRYEVGNLRSLNEDEVNALKRASTAIALGLSADDGVFQVDINTITFENENGNGTEQNCVNGTQCPDENAQCISVVDGFVCVCKPGFARPGNSSNCYNVNGETTYPSWSSTPFSQAVCTDNTWVKIPGASASNSLFQSGITSPAACQSKCLQNSTCQGIMWYSGNVQGCYFVINSIIYYGYGPYYVYYSLIRNQRNCDVNDTCIYVWIGMQYRQALGAVRDMNLYTLNDCIASCQNNPNCSAVDWDTNQNYCWHFLNTNESTRTQYYPYIYHFDKKCLDPHATTTTLSMPSTTPSVCPSSAVKYCEPTKQCLYSYQICDKYQDCPNDIDETNCTCNSSRYQCKNGRCIYRSWLCDGVEDCPLKDDESSPQCSTCNTSQFLCGKNRTCISKSQQCDGFSNCSDSQDEVNCLRLAGNGSTIGSNVSTQLVSATYRGVSDYFICSERWNDSWSDSVCQHIGYRKSYATSFRNVSRPASFLALNLSVSSPNLLAHLQISMCALNQAVAVSCVPSECGTRADSPPDSFGPYIINGQRAKRGAWPWQVIFEIGVYYSSDPSDFTRYSFCGGSLINDRWILTAAHCNQARSGIGYSGQVRPNNVRIMLGSLSLLGENDTVYARVDQVYTHPSYATYPVTDNDVGLLRLSEPVNFTDTIRPICLPTPTEDLSKFRVCVDTGFGQTLRGGVSNYLLQARMNIIPYRDCYYYRDYYLRPQTQICIGTLPTENDNNICFGDSGGPFACEDYTGAWKVIGVNSYVINGLTGISCARSIVARVTTYVQWIQQTMATNSV